MWGCRDFFHNSLYNFYRFKKEYLQVYIPTEKGHTGLLPAYRLQVHYAVPDVGEKSKNKRSLEVQRVNHVY
ncbi:hypothetical protein XELAEV_18044515mg [Xenopus laevis]|uniref:Uncharacterized protein n=1 Tax=Xenopus laevis TaxID=8355 RepID=A0A974BYN8_XENLA|nr:hypothetical protein XELAEV_18044515mg [Xenopus laevis]